MSMSASRHLFAIAVCGAVLLVAGCQAGMGPGPGTGAVAGGGQIVATPLPPNAKTVPPPGANSGLTSYKVYNTTEQLCDRTCKAEARCVRHSFQPISEINGYIAGQCQLYGRS